MTVCYVCLSSVFKTVERQFSAPRNKVFSTELYIADIRNQTSYIDATQSLKIYNVRYVAVLQVIDIYCG